MDDVERCRQAMREAQKAYMYSGKPDEALNNVRYDLVGIEAVMCETRLIDAEALMVEAWRLVSHAEVADWLKQRAKEVQP